MRRIITRTLAGFLAAGMAFAIAPAAHADDVSNVRVYIRVPDIEFTRTDFMPVADQANLEANAKFGEIHVGYRTTDNATLVVNYDGYLRNLLGVATARFALWDPSGAPLADGASQPLPATPDGLLTLSTQLVGAPPTASGSHTADVTLVLSAAD
ncbi:MAG: hypothetical protein FWF90_08040 [Promicromonosporaceae bacterium]|nr:hypothetical protein [Promicromonosporaceae bacterium]